jgi:uncharacterized protein
MMICFLSPQFNVKLYPHEWLVIFDEVQRFPVAREMIKGLVQDGRYNYIETGSLISLKLEREVQMLIFIITIVLNADAL